MITGLTWKMAKQPKRTVMDMHRAQIRFGIDQTIIPEGEKMFLEIILAKAELNKENMVR